MRSALLFLWWFSSAQMLRELILNTQQQKQVLEQKRPTYNNTKIMLRKSCLFVFPIAVFCCCFLAVKSHCKSKPQISACSQSEIICRKLGLKITPISFTLLSLKSQQNPFCRKHESSSLPPLDGKFAGEFIPL